LKTLFPQISTLNKLNDNDNKTWAESSDVKLGASLQGLDFIEISALDQNSRNFIEDCKNLILKNISSQITCLGCYKGPTERDLRPLFMLSTESGLTSKRNLLLFRLLEVGTRLNPSLEMAWRNLKTIIPRSYLTSGLDEFKSFPHLGRVYWSCRYFYPNTLLDFTKAEITTRSTSADCILRLFQELKTLEEQLCSHGNLRESNIGFDNHELFLLDPWFHANVAKTNSEHSRQNGPTLGARSLASLILNSFRPDLNQEALQVLIKFVSSDSDNLSFSDLHQAWARLVDKEKYNHEQSDHKAFSAGTAPRGRLIDLSQIKQPRPVQINETSEEPKPIASETIALQLEDKTQNLLLKKHSSLFLLVAGAASFIVLLLSGALNLSPSKFSQQELIELWGSAEQENQAEIARAALLDQDSRATNFLISELLTGKTIRGVDTQFIKNAFNELWIDQLNREDRIFALSVALAAIYRLPSQNLPDIEKIHPGIIFALIGKLNLAASSGKFDSQNLDNFASLPGTYGKVFKTLQSLGFNSLGNLAVRSVCRIILGNFGNEEITNLLSESPQEDKAIGLIATVTPFTETYPALAETILNSLIIRQDILGSRSRWFAEDNIAQWNKLSPKDFLFIALGIIPESVNELDKLSDLLLYPNKSIRIKAKDKVLKALGSQELSRLLNVIIEQPALLNRSQVLSLIAISQGPADKAHPFVTSWLDLEPHPTIVLEFLFATASKKSFDASSIQLANYLARKDFDLTESQLPLLLSHPEPLARILAFPRLDPNRELDRKILETWLKTETSARIKAEIERKLKGG
jgi:hypothetical protein